MMGRRVQLDGPLGPFRAGIEAELGRLGYSEGRTGQLMLLVGHVSRWMNERRLACGDLTDDAVAEFFATSRRSWCRSPRSLTPILGYLRAVGAAPAVQRKRVGRIPSEVELWEAFRRWCVDQRGMMQATADVYVERAEACLRGRESDGEIIVSELDARAVLAAVRAAADTLPGPSLRCTVTALRSLLRFLHATGRVPRPLVEAVPPLKARVRMILPSPVSTEVADRLVASCDTATATGCRDAAILAVLARLGLRAQEVASLRLDDIDWRRGEMRVTGKGGKVEVLPLPVDVGEALASYLSGGRSRTDCRAVFVKAVAPFGPMSSDGIGGVVRVHCDRAGLARFGPHRLRQLVATATLRAGAPLMEVAQLLRHDTVATTGIYANVDPASVAALARPWPEAAR